MKSTIRIDFIDRGTGRGLEPVIKVDIIQTDDPRDTLVSALFESLCYQSFLQLYYTNHKHTLSAGLLPSIEKRVLLFKPETDTDELMSIVRLYFCEWAVKQGWSAVHVELTSGTTYTRKNESISEDELFKQFVSEKTPHKG